MEIECPNCGTRYRVDANRLKPEGTRVRCSTCNHRFLAFPEWPSEDGWDLDLGLDLGEDEPAVERGAPDLGEALSEREPTQPAGDGGAAETPVAEPAPEPAAAPGPSRRERKARKRARAVRQADSSRRRSSWLLGLLVFLLVGGLVAELGYAFRAQLLGQPWVRSAVQGGLDLAGLEWELPIALRHYRVEAVNARLVTLASGRRVTLVEGLLINRAPFAQRPPRLELRASGPGGQVRFRRIKAPGTRIELSGGMDAADLRRQWEQARAAFPAAMAAGDEAPFVVVLTDVPAGIRRFQVEMVE